MGKISTTFVSGQVLSADNLNTLCSAINDNDNRIASIESLGISFESATNTLTIGGKSFVLGEGAGGGNQEPIEEYSLVGTFNNTSGGSNVDVNKQELSSAISDDGNLYFKREDGNTSTITVQGRSETAAVGQKSVDTKEDGYYVFENFLSYLDNSSIVFIRFIVGTTDIKVYKKN